MYYSFAYNLYSLSLVTLVGVIFNLSHNETTSFDTSSLKMNLTFTVRPRGSSFDFVQGAIVDTATF